MQDIKVADSRIEGSGPTRERRTGGSSILEAPKNSMPTLMSKNGATNHVDIQENGYPTTPSPVHHFRKQQRENSRGIASGKIF